jgi:peptidoglycan/LPS O-acetylase OafA/YrhL
LLEEWREMGRLDAAEARAPHGEIMRLNALDGWRGIACLIVAVFHFSANHSLYFQGWLRNCAPLLEFFFIVSGFVFGLEF